MKEKVLAILSKSHPEFDFTEEGIDFIEQGMLDSFDIVSIIASIEDEFAVEIPVDSMVAENFESAATIMNLVNGVKK